jgi:hypothetical protein
MEPGSSGPKNKEAKEMKYTKNPVIVDAFKMTTQIVIETPGGILNLKENDWLVIEEGEFSHYPENKFRTSFTPHVASEKVQVEYKPQIKKVELEGYNSTGLQGVLDKAAAAEKEKKTIDTTSKNHIYKTDKQIPFDCKTEKREYHRAWKLCKKHGLPYPEAVKKAREESEKKETSKAFSIGVVNLPAELKPLEEKKAFYKGASVIQVAGKKPYGLGCGEIIEIRANKDIVVEFYHGQKTLKRDEIAFYQQPATQKARGTA